MKIYSIRHQGEFTYDSYDSMIIVANTKTQVVNIAKSNSADEGEEVWDTATITEEGIYTGVHTRPFILLASFNAG